MRQRTQAAVFTVGHSTRTLGEFIALLAAHSVSQLNDVRTVHDGHLSFANGAVVNELDVSTGGHR